MKIATANRPPAPLRAMATSRTKPAVRTDSVELGASRPGDEPPPKKWTILQYSAADNNLYSWMIDDLDEAEVVGSTDTMNIVAQVDHGDALGAQRIYLTPDPRQGLHSPTLQEMGEVDMANPRTLADFVAWGVKNYPAQHYMVIISDHGDGWNGAVEDDSAGTWMSLPQIEEGLRLAREVTGRKLDVLGFDACLMASTEVAHELRNEADYLVASQETEGASGWPYTRLLNPEMLRTFQAALSTQLNMSPRELAEHAVNTAQKDSDNLPTMSAVDLSRVEPLVRAVDGLGRALETTTVDAGVLRELARQTQSFSGYRDLYDFADRIRKSPSVFDLKLRAHAHRVMEALQRAVVAEQHSDDYPDAHGLTVELRDTSGSYQQLAMARDTRWNEGVAHMQNG